jgi:glycerol kinase
MSEPLLLALDQGTTSTRAILFDAHGRELASAGRPLRQSYPADGWVEHDAEEIFQASVTVLRETVQRSGRDLAQVTAIGVTNQRETVVLWDRETGRAVAPAIVWQDQRTADVCERLLADGAEGEVTERTGLLLAPYFSGTKLAWLLDNVPGARRAAEAGKLLAGTVDAWVIWRLTDGAVHATDATNASRTLLFDLERQTWDADLCRLFGVPQQVLPEVRDCAADYGTTAPGVLGRAVPIRGVAGDQQAALMGQGCIRPGEMKATYGTGCFLLLNTGERRPRSSARLLSTVAARVQGRVTYALEGSIFIAGAAIQWVNEQLGIPGGPATVEALAGTARADHGVVFVPAFTGLGAPWWSSEARGTICGLTRDTGVAEIAAAAFDAAAWQTDDLVEAMRGDAPEAFGASAVLRIDGGMAGSRRFPRRLADLTGLPVARARYPETTALGAALFAGLGAGVFGSVQEAAAARPEAEDLQPELATEQRAAARERWRAAVGRTAA